MRDVVGRSTLVFDVSFVVLVTVSILCATALAPFVALLTSSLER